MIDEQTSPLPPVEVTRLRCLTFAARHWFRLLGQRCTSPWECVDCACPAKRRDAPCEQCGSRRFQVLRVDIYE